MRDPRKHNRVCYHLAIWLQIISLTLVIHGYSVTGAAPPNNVPHFRSRDEVPQRPPTKYKYSYNVRGIEGDQHGHQASHDGPFASGKYYVKLNQGTSQNVEYYTDQLGYHPKVTYRSQLDSGKSGARVILGGDANSFSVSLLSLSIFLIAFATAIEQPVEGKHGTLIRQKKRIVTMKKPFRYHERVRGRQTNYHRSTVSSLDEFAIIGTSENPNGNWKPIPYAHYAAETVPSVENKSVPVNAVLNVANEEGGKPAAVNAVTNGGSGHIERVNTKNSVSDTPSTPPQQEHVSNEQFEDYALLHYYIPFDQFVAHQTSKPITETFQDIPPKTISIEQLMKAAVEPIPVFRLETTSTSTSTSTTPAPSTTAKTEPPTTTTTTTTASVPLEPTNKSEDDEFAGRYEYEYFVQDNHWGTNFGHKEFRDGKQTKGDYEVVLPDGRVQHVQYWSDATGYHASVTYHPLYKKFKQFKLQP